jgi:cytolysin-activating lysine-acyltransferase
MTDPTAPTSAKGAAPTFSHLLGEMTWLLSQSPMHRKLAIETLEWLVMPPLLLEQFYLFRDGDRPVGLALWAKCTPQTVRKLEEGLLKPGSQLTLEEWSNGDEVWLVDLIAPFATPENHHREVMLADLIAKPLKGVAFKFHQTDPATGKRTVADVPADASDKMLEALVKAVEGPSSGQ